MMVQFLAGLGRNGSAAINVFFFLQTVGRQLKGPGEDQGGNQPDGQQGDDKPDRSIRQAINRKKSLDNLDNEPGGYDVGYRDA